MNTLPADTLRPDSILVAELQRNPDYAYAVVDEKPSLLGMVLRKLYYVLDKAFDLTDDTIEAILYATGGAICLVAIWWLVRTGRLNRLFGRRDTADDSYGADETERDIHSVDLDAALRRARAEGNLTRVARLTYLLTLKGLADRGCIDWQPHKTPGQYSREAADAAFAELTTHFMRIRYGNRKADAALVELMERLQAEVQKGGAR